jgi:hypothetical protein
VVERVVCLADPVFVHLLSEVFVREGNASLGIDAKQVVVSDHMMDRHFDQMLRPAIEFVEAARPLPALPQCVEDMIAALHGKIRAFTCRIFLNAAEQPSAAVSSG